MMRLTFFAHQRGDGHGDGEVGLAGAGRAQAEGHVAACSMASTYFRWLGERGCTMRFTPAERCRPESTRDLSVTAGSAMTSLSMPLSSPFCRVTPAAAEALVVGEDALHLFGTGGSAGDVDGVAAEIDGDVETIFQESKVFVAGPVQGLNAGCNLERLFDQAVG